MIFPGHDFAYITASKAIPPYNINAGYNTSTGTPPVYYPNMLYGGLYWYQDTTGDSPGDQRIGYVDQFGVSSIYNPADPIQLRGSLISAMCYDQAVNSYMYDETNGLPFVANNGPSNDGTPNPNFPSVIPTWGTSFNPGWANVIGNGFRAHTRGNNWGAWAVAEKDLSGFAFQGYSDNSHAPFPCFVAYLKTGDPLTMKQGIAQADGAIVTAYCNGTILSDGSTKVYCVGNANVGSLQCRDLAWLTRTLFQAHYMTSDDNPFKQVLADYYRDNFRFTADYYTNTMHARGKVFGNIITSNFGGGGMAQSCFSYSFYDMVVSMEMWRGGQVAGTATDVTTTFNYLRNYYDIYLPSGGDALYYTGAYGLSTGTTQFDYSTCYITGPAVASATYVNGFNQNMVAPYTENRLYNHEAGGAVPWILSPNGYATTVAYTVIGRAALTIRNAADPADSTMATLKATWDTKISAGTGISTATGGIPWTGADANYQVNAIF